jgi:hypothetical protein
VSSDQLHDVFVQSIMLLPLEEKDKIFKELTSDQLKFF